MKHVSETQLALLVGNELPWYTRWSVSRHVAGCADCRRRQEQYRADREWLQEFGDEMPPDVNWSRLSAEMAANIRVGIEAAECVAPVIQRDPRPSTWATVALASALSMLGVGWYLNVPRVKQLAAPVIQSKAEGLEVRGKKGSLLLRSPRGSDTLYLSEPNSVRARYVDQDSGQIQIVKVYAD